MCILSKCFEMRAGGEDYYSRCLLVTLGMCCFPQWEKLIPCLEVGGATLSNPAISGSGHRGQEATKLLPFTACCFGFQVRGMWISVSGLSSFSDVATAFFSLCFLQLNTDLLFFLLV